MLQIRIEAVVLLCVGAFLMTLGIRGWDIFVLKSCFRGYKYSKIMNRIAAIILGFLLICWGVDMLLNW